MMSSIHPREFFDIYVATSLEHYMQNRLVKHLAVNALSQIDNLAEIVAMHQLPLGRTELKRGEASQYREQLRSTYPVLGVVTDAHDCHKHNKLTRKSVNDPIGMKEGRPEQVTDERFFLDETELGGDLTPYDTLAVTLNDGMQWELVELLCEAIRAWKSEFQALGI